MRFEEWKARASSIIADIISHSNDNNMRVQLRGLLHKLNYARTIDVSRIINDVVILADYWKINKLYEIIPKTEEIEEWFRKE